MMGRAEQRGGNKREKKKKTGSPKIVLKKEFCAPMLDLDSNIRTQDQDQQPWKTEEEVHATPSVNRRPSKTKRERIESGFQTSRVSRLLDLDLVICWSCYCSSGTKVSVYPYRYRRTRR